MRNNQGFLWLENSWVGEKKVFDNSLSLFRHFQRHIGHRYYILASENYNKKQWVAGCFCENRLIPNSANSNVLNLWSFTAVFPWVWILQIEKFEDFESWISIFFLPSLQIFFVPSYHHYFFKAKWLEIWIKGKPAWGQTPAYVYWNSVQIKFQI